MENEKRTTVSTEAAPAKTSAKRATTKSAAVKAATDTSEPVKVKATRSRRASSAVTSTSGSPKAAAAPAAVVTESPVVETAAAEPAAAPKKAPTRRSRAKKVTPDVEATSEPSLLDAIAEPKTPAKRTTRRRATSPVTAPSAAASDQGVQGELSLSAQEAPAVEAAPVEAEAPIKAPAKRTRRAKAPVTSTAAPAVEKAAEVPAVVIVEEPSAPEAPVVTETVEAPAAKRPARRSRRAAAPAQSAVSAPAAVIAVTEPVAPEAVAAAVEAPAEAAPARSGSTRNRRRSSAASGPATPAPELTAPVAEQAAEAAAPAAEQASESLFLSPAAGMSALFLAPDLSLAVPVATESSEDSAKDGNDGDRRGRGRNRNRRRNETEQADAVEPAEAELDDEEATDDGVTSRRRRRRRRGDQDLELTGGTDEDPPNTVTRVRAPRTPAAVEAGAGASDRVTSLRGSTRLEAKKQRRRDSRDSGRRRTVITEAEFLARRESVDRVMVVRQSDDRIQIGVLEDGILAEHFVSKTQQDSLIGNVYLGKVQNVLPSMEAAFVDIGRGRNAVLYAGEVDWDAANLNGQPRRIENALKSGDSVLVQVSKDPVGHKGARLTSQISLPGRYLVFVPGGSMTGISRKLPDVERNRLKRVLKDHLPENAGVIVRTAAEGASEEELTNDINRLRAQWAGINERATSHKTLAPEMLYGEPDLTIKVVRDVFNEDFSKLVVSGEDAWDTIEAYVTYVAPDLLDRLEKWSKSEDIFAAHRIDEQINKALERKVFLPSGGSLVIDRTEAMTVVDVNTGKFTGSGGNLEETVTKNNLEAAEEVVRQLRLRDIGGIIVIDFIDMVLESNRDLVLRRLVECLGRDRTKHQVAEVTSLGLVQMTRKRMGTGLLEVFGELCPSCAGRGMVTHEIPVEHRRSHSPAVEVAQMHTHVPAPKQEPRENERTANRSTRSERKRNRNRNQPSETETAPEVTPVVVADEVSEAAKAQKAHEARAALANIAAAAAASHQERVAAETAPEQSTTSDDAATLTLGGEAIELPRGHRSESNDFAGSNTADRAAALADLTQALDQLVAPGTPSAPEASVSHDEEGETNGNSRSRSRRGRRNRSARSAQGSTDSAVETSGQAPAAQGFTVQSSDVAEKVAAPVVKKASEPIILGVGVPASEL
ncbi:ribonuclease E/G [Arthrobacter psychrolactophilus]|uniref:Ribonuclease E n=1 Tax=Arthrobacter psychrolactophilus TaxID=92442 RepID=A0A2V5J6E3_9MICC|nr:Rne/Rng family ribonuclease [Arthrobacter psychrolactophilus]PYI38190.1 ribonuclease E/G [Arthrobacter psychrolactophilus]